MLLFARAALRRVLMGFYTFYLAKGASLTAIDLDEKQQAGVFQFNVS